MSNNPIAHQAVKQLLERKGLFFLIFISVSSKLGVDCDSIVIAPARKTEFVR